VTLVKDMLDATISDTPDIARIAALLEAVQDAERASTSCAAAMLVSGHGMADAVAADLALADVCQAASRILSRQATADDVVAPLLASAAAAARRSYAQCSQHAHHHAHCRLCSDASQRVFDLVG
jgi:hypothetical protein